MDNTNYFSQICFIDLLLRNIGKMWINNPFQNFFAGFQKIDYYYKLVENLKKPGKHCS